MAALRTLLDRQLSFERRPGVDGCEPGPFTFLIRSIRKASSRYFEDYKIEGCDVDFQKLETFLSKDSIQYDRKLDKITYRGQEGKSRAIRTSESFGVAIDVLDKQLKNNLEVPLSFIITRLSQEEIASNVKIEGHRRNKRVKLEDLKDSPFSQPSSVNSSTQDAFGHPSGPVSPSGHVFGTADNLPSRPDLFSEHVIRASPLNSSTPSISVAGQLSSASEFIDLTQDSSDDDDTIVHDTPIDVDLTVDDQGDEDQEPLDPIPSDCNRYYRNPNMHELYEDAGGIDATRIPEFEFVDIEDEQERQRRLDEHNDIVQARQLQNMLIRGAAADGQGKAAPILARTAWAEWQQTVELFGCKYADYYPATQIPLRGLGYGHGLNPYQAVLVTFIIRTAMGPAHCAINAAAPGLGKSLVDIALLVMVNHLADMWEEVDEDRRARGGKHLPALGPNEKPDPDHQCPSRDENGLHPTTRLFCPCDASKIQSTLRPRYGIFFVVLPRKVLRTMADEFRKFIDPNNNPLQLQLVYAHRSGKTKAETACYTDQYIEGLLGEAQDDETKDTPPIGRRQNLRYFVITTAESARNHFFKWLIRERQVVVPAVSKQVLRRPRGKPSYFETAVTPATTRTEMWVAVVIAWWIRDEFHVHKLKSSRTLLLLADKDIIRGDPHLLWQSGTPWNQGPQDIDDILDICERDGWNEDPLLHYTCKTQRQNVSNKWRELTRAREYDVEAMEACMQTFHQIISPILVYMDHLTEVCGTGVIMTLPTKVVVYMMCKHTDEQAELSNRMGQDDSCTITLRNKAREDKWIQGGRKGTFQPLLHKGISIRYRARVVSAIPGLFEMVKRGFRLTEYEMVQRGIGLYNKMDDPYYKEIRDIAKSGLLICFQDFIKGPVEQETYLCRDGERRLTPIAFSSHFASVVHCFHLFMVKYLDIPDNDIAFVHPICGDAVNTITLARFGGTNYDDSDDVKQPRYIVALSRYIGEGINDLTRCKYLVTCNPGPDPSKDIQREGRLWRPGNPHKEIYMIRLYADKDETEKAIIKKSLANTASSLSKMAHGNVLGQNNKDD